MKRPVPRPVRDPFAAVKAAGLTLPGVEVATRYDGSPMLKVGGAFMAALATHPSAEPGTLVVRSDVEDRRYLLEEAPEGPWHLFRGDLSEVLLVAMGDPPDHIEVTVWHPGAPPRRRLRR